MSETSETSEAKEGEGPSSHGPVRRGVDRALASWGWVNRLLVQFFAAIMFFSIAKRSDWITSVSETVGLVAGYWRFLRSLPFRLLPFTVDPIAQDVIALAMLAYVAASVACRYEYGVGLLAVARSVFNERRKPKAVAAREDVMNRVQKKDRWFALFLFGAAVAMLIVLSFRLPYFFLLVVSQVVLTTILIKGVDDGWIFNTRLAEIITWALTPLSTFVMVLILMVRFQRAVMHTAVWVLGVLALNWLLVWWGDPIAPLLSRIPPPPPTP
jgi:hypothetical protein